MSYPEDFKKHSKTIDFGFRSTNTLGGGFGYKSVRDLPLEGQLNKLQLRSIAKDKIREISGSSSCLQNVLDRPTHGWSRFAGQMGFSIRTHDDFRGIEAANAPRIILWAAQLPNHDGSVTLLVLHGTADGNLRSSELAELPTDRAGSDTERIFEYFWIANRGMGTEELPSKLLEPANVAERCIWMIGHQRESHRGYLESIFEVHYDEMVPERQRNISPFAFPSRDQRPPVVSRIIIGSPLLVQSMPSRSRFWRKVLKVFRKSLSSW